MRDNWPTLVTRQASYELAQARGPQDQIKVDQARERMTGDAEHFRAG